LIIGQCQYLNRLCHTMTHLLYIVLIFKKNCGCCYLWFDIGLLIQKSEEQSIRCHDVYLKYNVQYGDFPSSCIIKISVLVIWIWLSFIVSIWTILSNLIEVGSYFTEIWRFYYIIFDFYKRKLWVNCTLITLLLCYRPNCEGNRTICCRDRPMAKNLFSIVDLPPFRIFKILNFGHLPVFEVWIFIIVPKFIKSGWYFLRYGRPPSWIYAHSNFLPARRYASAGNSDHNVSVRPSRAGIVSKRRKLAAWFLHRLVAPRL